MHLDRRTVLRSGVYGCLAVVIKQSSLLAQSLPPGDLDVIATVLRAQADQHGKRPVLIATEPFSTGPMTVLAKKPLPIEVAAHKVELPYLLPPTERITEAEELTAAYNRSLERAALPITKSAAFDFPHRLLDDQVVSQFEALYPGGNVYSEELERKRRAVSSRYRLFFDGSSTLWRVSRVAFASGGAVAVVGLRSSGGSCWSEDWQVLERSQGVWHSLHWGGGRVTCG